MVPQGHEADGRDLYAIGQYMRLDQTPIKNPPLGKTEASRHGVPC